MHILLPGLRKFSERIFPKQQTLFQNLTENQQKPHTLMITCSDSRVDPSLVTQTKPGEMFVMRNAGNIVPPYGSDGGEEAAIEFAVDVLGVSNIVVCGHSQCGAMNALLKPDHVHNLPALKRWLAHSQESRRRVQERKEPETVNALIQANALVQAEHLKSHPSVAEALRLGRVQIFAWIYNLESGSIAVYDPSTKNYIPSTQVKEDVERDVSKFAL